MTIAPVSTGGETEQQWAQGLLSDLDAPDTANNEDNILQWMTAEEPTDNWFDRNNPLNASLGTSSTSGLGSYPNLQVADQETADMIEQTNMSGIANALRSNASPDAFSAAVVGSPWASSHYGGNPDYIANIPTPGGSITAPSGAQLDSVSGAIGSAIGGGTASAVEGLFGINGGAGLATRILLGIVALIFLAIGLDKLFDSSASPADIVVQAPQSVSNQAGKAQSFASKGKGQGRRPPMAQPHKQAPQSKGKPKGTPFQRGKHVAGKGAAKIAETGAAAAVA